MDDGHILFSFENSKGKKATFSSPNHSDIRIDHKTAAATILQQLLKFPTPIKISIEFNFENGLKVGFQRKIIKDLQLFHTQLLSNKQKQNKIDNK